MDAAMNLDTSENYGSFDEIYNNLDGETQELFEEVVNRASNYHELGELALEYDNSDLVRAVAVLDPEDLTTKRSPTIGRADYEDDMNALEIVRDQIGI